MKPFVFRFQKILDWREHLETQEKHKFARVLKKYADKERELKDKVNKKREYLSESNELLKKGEIESLIWRDRARQALTRGIEDGSVELQAEAEKLDVARRELVEFTRKKKIMEKLKEKDKEKYEKELKRLEKHINSEIGQNIIFKRDFQNREEV